MKSSAYIRMRERKNEKIMYRKEESFLLFFIFIYYIMMRISISFSIDIIGFENAFIVPVQLFFFLFLLIFLRRKHLLDYYGLKKLTNLDHRKLLYYIPFFIPVVSNFFYGIAMKMVSFEMILAMIFMFFTGFFEEFFFRCVLFKLIQHKNTGLAVFISSAGFGILHLWNLTGGAEPVPTLLQLCYTMAVGFMFTIFFYKTGNILPCMICHSLVNITSIIILSGSMQTDIIFTTIVSLSSILYGIYLLKEKNSANK